MLPLFNPHWKSVMQMWSLCAVRAPYGMSLCFLGVRKIAKSNYYRVGHEKVARVRRLD